jgi:hypothetical protein
VPRDGKIALKIYKRTGQSRALKWLRQEDHEFTASWATNQNKILKDCRLIPSKCCTKKIFFLKAIPKGM